MERYDILAKLAEGGMGEVLLARATGEHGFKKLVAVKRIRPELAADPEFFVRFVTEAKVTVSLSHANIVQVFDLAKSGSDLFLVMELVRGADFSLLLNRARELSEQVPVPLVLHIAAEALKGLAYAHGRSRPGSPGIIHCDLSPSNLLVSYSGEVKLADFGIAQAVARRQTADGRVMGKKQYMSPEQSAGRKLDARTNLYALGVVLKNALQVGEPADTWPVARAPAELVRLIDAMSAEALEARPPSATEVLKSVAQVGRLTEAGTPLTAPEVGAWVARLVPPPPERDDEEFARALGQVLGASPSMGTQSRQTPARTFIAKAQRDGTTVWEAAEEELSVPSRARPGRGRALVAAAGLALGGAAFGGWLLLRPSVTPVAPVAPVAPVVSAPGPVVAVPPPPEPVEPAAPPTPVLTGAAVKTADARQAEPRTKVSRRNLKERAAPGFLNVFAEPWANVVIDGRKVGTTPLRSVSLAPGSHQIRLEHPSRRPVEKAVQISSGRTELLDVELQRAEP